MAEAGSVEESVSSLLAACAPRSRINDAVKADLSRLPPTGSPFATLTLHTRTRVWESLLGCPVLTPDARSRLLSDISSTVLDLPNARVVRVDSERTRADLAHFAVPSMHLRISRLLTHYVKRGHALGVSDGTPPVALGYKQGLNEVLAVFLQLTDEAGEPLDDARVSALFARFVARFAPRIYASRNDDEFTSLQCTFRLFRLLVMYHDPALCAALDQYDVAPELYATPWFLTLLSRSNATEHTMALWDVLIACVRQPGAALFHCVALALLLTQKDAVVAHTANAHAAAELPLVMAKLSLTSVQHVHRICHMAVDLWSQTPLSFRRLMHNVSYSGGFHGGAGEPLPISNALLTRLEARVAIKISVDELLVGTASRFSPPSRHDAPAATADSYMALQGMQRLTVPLALQVPQRYFLLDCRSRAEYECSGHLPTAFHMDPELLQDPEKLNEIAAGFAGLKGMHFAIMGPGNVSQWYHAPVPPRSDVEPAAARSADSGNDDTTMFDYGITLQSAQRDGAGSLEEDDEYVAVRSGLDPLSSNEEDDYAPEDATRAFIFFFLQKGFTHVSEVEGGFTALHQHQAHYLDTLLVGHDRTMCMVCTGGKAAAQYTDAAKSAAREHASPRRRVPDVAFPDSQSSHRQQRYHALKAWIQPGLANVTGATRALAQQARKALSSDDRAPNAEDEADEVEIVLFPDMESAAHPSTRVVAAATASVASAAPSTSSTPAPRTRRPVSTSKQEYVTGYDMDGFPILSEEAWLDLQCDELERDARVAAARAKGRSVAPIAALGRPAVVESPEPMYVDEMIADAAVAAAHRAASAAKSILWSVLAPPEHDALTAAEHEDDGEAHSSTFPKTISLAAFTAESDGAAAVSAKSASSSQGGDDAHLPLPPATQRVLPASSGTASKITAQTSRYIGWLARKAQAVMSTPESGAAAAPASAAADGKRKGPSV